MALSDRIDQLRGRFEVERSGLPRAEFGGRLLDGVVGDGGRRDERVGRRAGGVDGREHLGGALDGADRRVVDVGAVVDERHRRAADVTGAGDLAAGSSRGTVRQHADRIDRLAGRSRGDDDVAAREVRRRRRPRERRHDGRLARDFGLPLLDAWLDERDAPRLDALDGIEHAGVVVHRLVHRGGDDDRDVRAEGRRRRRRHGRVVDGGGDLADGVGGRRREQQHVGPPLAATEFDVFDPAGELGDHVVVGGELQGPRVDDAGGALAHHRTNRRAVPAEFVGEFDGFHRGDASRDAQCDVDPLEHSFVTSVAAK